MEFLRGSRAIAAKTGINLFAAAITLTRRNTRRYGGYIVHLGIVLIFVGLTGAIFNREQKSGIHAGDRIQLGAYALNVREISTGENENYLWQRASIDVFEGPTPIGTLAPQREYYKAANQAVGRVDIRHSLNEDLYVNFAGVNADNLPVVEAYLFPLVNWIWIGALVLLCGTLVTLMPGRDPDREPE